MYVWGLMSLNKTKGHNQGFISLKLI